MTVHTPYFNVDPLPDAKPEYVGWLDVMGIQSIMSRSIRITANFVFKLHVAALDATHDQVTLYPVMDGLYAATESRPALEEFASGLLAGLATTFVTEPNPLHRFVVKGAIAFGPVVHGNDVPPQCSKSLANNPGYRQQLLLGLPMVQAHQSERFAPPFGVFVHESARTFAPGSTEPFHNAWWNWLRKEHSELRTQLGQKLNEHYRWCEDHAHQLLYESERIGVHREMAREFLEACPIGG